MRDEDWGLPFEQLVLHACLGFQRRQAAPCPLAWALCFTIVPEFFRRLCGIRARQRRSIDSFEDVGHGGVHLAWTSGLGISDPKAGSLLLEKTRDILEGFETQEPLCQVD